jgi:hypothetical protein
MPNYIDPKTNLVRSYSTEPDPALGLLLISDEDYIALMLKLAPPLTDAEAAHVIFKTQAQAALDKSDVTMNRCVENSVPVPATWAAYRKALRAIINGGDTASTALPAVPPYPAGT